MIFKDKKKKSPGMTIFFREMTILRGEFCGNTLSMAQRPTLLRHIYYTGFLAVCALGFFFSCCGFLLYRLLLKPLVFCLMLLAILPLMLFSQLHTLAAEKNKKNDVPVGKAQTKEL